MKFVEDTTLFYSIDHPDPENITVTVVPINEVGAGQPATLQFLSFPTNTSVSIRISPTSIFYMSSAATTVSSSYVNATGVAPPTSPTQLESDYIFIIIAVAIPVLIISVIGVVGVLVIVIVCQKKRKSKTLKSDDSSSQRRVSGQGTAGDQEMRPRFEVSDGDEDEYISSEGQKLIDEPDGQDSLSALPTIPNANKTSRRILSAIYVPHNRTAVVCRLPAVQPNETGDSIEDTYFFLPEGCPTRVHLLPDSELPPNFLSAPENAATDEIALQVLTPVKESRSDLDLKNLPQIGIGSKRRHSALTLGSLRLKFSASKKEPLLDENCHHDAEDDEQHRSEENNQIGADIAQNTSSTFSLESDRIQPWESRYAALPFVKRLGQPLSTDNEQHATISSTSQDQNDSSVSEQGKKSEVPTSDLERNNGVKESSLS